MSQLLLSFLCLRAFFLFIHCTGCKSNNNDMSHDEISCKLTKNKNIFLFYQLLVSSKHSTCVID